MLYQVIQAVLLKAPRPETRSRYSPSGIESGCSFGTVNGGTTRSPPEVRTSAVKGPFCVFSLSVASRHACLSCHHCDPPTSRTIVATTVTAAVASCRRLRFTQRLVCSRGVARRARMARPSSNARKSSASSRAV